MRTNRFRRAAVGLAVLTGVLGLGVGRADAATPTQVTRYAKDFVVTLRAGGSGVNMVCSGIVSSWTSSVTSPLGTTRSGGDRWFTCNQGDRQVRLDYKLESTYRSDRYSTGRHLFYLSWRPDANSLYPSCRVWSRDSEIQGYVTTTEGTRWGQTTFTAGNSNTCGGVYVQAQIQLLEGRSAA